MMRNKYCLWTLEMIYGGLILPSLPLTEGRDVPPLQARKEQMPNYRRITPQSLHILVNLHRVVDRPYKLEVNSPRRRSQLDGIECTAQITSLVVGGFVSEDNDGMFTRTNQGKLLELERSLHTLAG